MARYIFIMARWSLVAVVLAIAFAPKRAAADEIAPELETLELRQKAQAEMRRAFGALAEKDRRRLVGTYLAIDPSPAEPIAQAACDDDGDYVVVLSDALLVALEHFARATAEDDTGALARRYASSAAIKFPRRNSTSPISASAAGKGDCRREAYSA